MCASRPHQCQLGTRIRRQDPRLPRAATRLWVLTAQRDRASKPTVPSMRTSDAQGDESQTFARQCPTGRVLVFAPLIMALLGCSAEQAEAIAGTRNFIPEDFLAKVHGHLDALP